MAVLRAVAALRAHRRRRSFRPHAGTGVPGIESERARADDRGRRFRPLGVQHDPALPREPARGPRLVSHRRARPRAGREVDGLVGDHVRAGVVRRVLAARAHAGIPARRRGDRRKRAKDRDRSAHCRRPAGRTGVPVRRFADARRHLRRHQRLPVVRTADRAPRAVGAARPTATGPADFLSAARRSPIARDWPGLARRPPHSRRPSAALARDWARAAAVAAAAR